MVRDILIHDQPDVVVLIVNAAALERNLYLLAELLGLPVEGRDRVEHGGRGRPAGDHDRAACTGGRPGVAGDTDGAPVNPGRAGTARAAVCVGRAIRRSYTPNRPEIRADHEAVLVEIDSLIAGMSPQPYPEDWVALKLLEGDAEIAQMMKAALGDAVASPCMPF